MSVHSHWRRRRFGCRIWEGFISSVKVDRLPHRQRQANRTKHPLEVIAVLTYLPSRQDNSISLMAIHHHVIQNVIRPDRMRAIGATI